MEYDPVMAMDKRDPKLRQAMAETALALPGVFEETKWGGWVYKVVGRGGTKKTSSKAGGAKMLCYVVDGKNHGWHCQFKLPGNAEEGRAHDVVEKTAWVEEHPWKTLGPSGWVVARPRTKPQLKKLAGLLAESRALLPKYDDEAAAEPAESADSQSSSTASGGSGGAVSSNVARRFDSVMREAREKGWQHADPDAAAFDDPSE
ncbi:MAG: hypothetical protein AAGH99_15555 [Planctomycetota bacterium]